LALAKAADLAGLATLRQGLRAKVTASPLCDGAALAQDFSRIVRMLWEDACRRCCATR
jgi:protein O-GlcNAc transferase